MRGDCRLHENRRARRHEATYGDDAATKPAQVAPGTFPRRGRRARPERWLTPRTSTLQYAATPKAVHRRMPGDDPGGRLALCGKLSAALTTDPAQVTCGVCQRARERGGA